MVELVVTFGPSRSPLLPRALARARLYAAHLAEGEDGSWSAVFALDRDQVAYGRALTFLQLVQDWRGTEVEVDGSPESPSVVARMLSSARAWLRIDGSCRQVYWSGRPLPECLICPLYDVGWARESGVRTLE